MLAVWRGWFGWQPPSRPRAREEEGADVGAGGGALSPGWVVGVVGSAEDPSPKSAEDGRPRIESGQVLPLAQERVKIRPGLEVEAGFCGGFSRAREEKRRPGRWGVGGRV